MGVLGNQPWAGFPGRPPRSFPGLKGHPGSDRFGCGCHWCAEKSPWQQPRAQQQLHLSESLWKRDNWSQDCAGGGGASERGCGHVLLPLELDFRVLKCYRPWGTIQDVPRHCTNSKIRDSKPQDSSISILTIYETSKETKDDREAAFPDLLSRGG